MQRDCAINHQYLFAHAAASAALLLATAVSGFAQQGVGPRTDPEAARIRDEQQREMQLRSKGTEAGRVDERPVKVAAEQLNQDFKRIQVIRNDVAHALKGGDVLDYKRISGQTAEVQKRALRMQSYLALRGPDDGGKENAGDAVYDDVQIKGALVLLCKRIDSFVANPKFTSPGIVDVEGTARAGRDLREIISMSSLIRGSAERLGRKNK